MGLFIVKLFILVLFLGGCLFLPKAQNHEIKDQELVYIVAGQSNAVSYIGDAYKGSESKVLRWSTSGKVFINESLNMPNSDHRHIFSPTKDNPTEYSIAWMYCGEEIVKATKKKVTFINMAWGGSLTRSWVDPRLMVRFFQAIHDFKPKAIIWHQGEFDEKFGIPERESYDNMKMLIQLSRTVISDLPWIIAINSQSPPSDQTPIRRAQKRIIADGLALEGPDTDTLRLDRSNMDQENLHFVGIGAKKHGLMWFEALKKENLL